MISRYTLYTTADLRDHFSLDSGLPKGVRPHYNIHPTLDAPVIISRDNKVVVQQMNWGLTPKGTTNTHSVFRYKTYNTPSEKILSKHSWETAIRQYRCLIPVNGFYLLGEKSDQQAFYLQVKDTPLVALAGIYSSWQDEAGEHATYSIITSEAPESLHIATRLPIIIEKSEEARWLDPTVTDANALFDMLRPTSNEYLTITRVGADIYSQKIDSSKLILPL